MGLEHNDRNNSFDRNAFINRVSNISSKGNNIANDLSYKKNKNNLAITSSDISYTNKSADNSSVFRDYENTGEYYQPRPPREYPKNNNKGGAVFAGIALIVLGLLFVGVLTGKPSRSINRDDYAEDTSAYAKVTTQQKNNYDEPQNAFVPAETEEVYYETTTVATTQPPAKVDPDSFTFAPDPPKQLLMQQHINAGASFTDPEDFVFAKSGAYGFEIYSENDEREIVVSIEDDGFVFGCKSHHGTYLEKDRKYRIRSKASYSLKNPADISVYVYSPTDPIEIDGSFGGNMFFKYQEQDFLFTPEVSGRYNFDMISNDDANFHFKIEEYGNSSGYPMSTANIINHDTANVDLEAGVTYRIKIQCTSQHQGKYEVRIS